MSDSTPPTDSNPAFPSERHVLDADCARCPALVEHRECIAWGTGPLEASVLVVGEAPGHGNPEVDRWRGGNWTGMSYTSRHSGRRIREMLAAVGYGDDAFYTNAVKCFPADPADPTTNREPTAEERSACRDHLLAELELVDPAVVLATGKHATTTVLAFEDESLDGFLETVLEPRWCERLGVWLLPVLHPSYQDIWLGRLDYDAESYLEDLQTTLDSLIDGSDGEPALEGGEPDGDGRVSDSR